MMSNHNKHSIGMTMVLVVSAVSATAAVLSTLNGNGALTLILGIPAYLFLPGMLIQLAFRRNPLADLNGFLYSIGISLIYWILGGLLLNETLPYLGINRPLQLTFIIPFYILTLGVMTLIALRNGRVETFEIDSGTTTRSTKLAVRIAALFPILSVVGSTTLNNYGTGYLTMGMLTLMCGYILFLTIRFNKISDKAYPLIIFSIALSLLLMYSLRSWYVIGWDVHDELRIFGSTFAQERWQMSFFPGNAYNACLSITVLPTILAKLLHMSPEYLFKFVYQLFFAVVPVAVYSLARKYLIPILAMMAALLFTIQTWFFEQMPALARQEIGILLFIILVVALFDQGLSRRARLTLSYLFTIGLVLSHYSTAYIWFVIATIAYIFSWVLRILSKNARKSPWYLPWHLILSLGLLIVVWEGPMTNTVGHAGSVASNGLGQIGQLLSPNVIKDGIQRAFIASPAINTDKTILEAERTAYSQRSGGASEYYSSSVSNSYIPKAVDDHQYAHTYVPNFISRVIIIGASVVRIVMTNLFSLLGILLLWLTVLRRDKKVSPDIVALFVGSYLLILLMLFLPYLQANYNLTRLYLQLFSLLAIPSIVAFWFLVRKNIKYGLPIIGLSIAVALMSLSGLVDQFTGGGLRITMTQPRGTFDTFYVYTDEVYAAKWLAGNRDSTVPIFADPIANLRLQSYGGIDTKFNDIFPSAIKIRGYVYLIDANTKRYHSFTAYDNNTLTYNTPTDFLQQNKDLIYSSGGAQIYR